MSVESDAIRCCSASPDRLLRNLAGMPLFPRNADNVAGSCRVESSRLAERVSGTKDDTFVCSQ
jgi:hypothetical protein